MIPVGCTVAYCFGLKLALLFQPENCELHEFILSQMDFTALAPYLLEVTCFVGKFLGTKNKYFKQLFAMKPWLLGDQEPPFDPNQERR